MLACAALAVPALLAGAALAQKDGWYPYESVSGAFEVLLPQENKETTSEFRISDSRVLYSTEVSAVVDHRPFKDVIKRYIVKADQTLGVPITHEEIASLIDREVATYTQHYKKMNGVVRDQTELLVLNYPARELIITFDDPQAGPQALRVTLMFTGVTKYQQVFIGPEDTVFAYQTKDFFDSINLHEGFALDDGTFGENWTAHVSPLEIFTLLLPPVTPPYVPAEPVTSYNEKTDVVSLVLFDPVWSQQVFYNTYGYRFDKSLTFSDVQQVMIHNHIAKYKIGLKEMSFTKTKLGEFPVLEVAFAIPAQAHLSGANYVKLRAVFFGNFAAIQEVISRYPIVAGDFTGKMMEMIQFQPQQAHERWQRDWQAQNGKDAAQ